MLWEQSCRSVTRIWPPRITYRDDSLSRKKAGRNLSIFFKVTAEKVGTGWAQERIL